MGHACQILTFPVTMSTRKISAECGEWATYNCDLQERCGRGFDYLDVRFTDKVFNSYDEAEEYLNSTFGNYREIAVKYKKYPKVQPNKNIADLERRIDEYSKRCNELNKPHYASVTQKTVKCKSCGSSLATEYCGKTYRNICPICRADLRPESVLKKLADYEKTIQDLQKRKKEEEKKQNQKNARKAELMWAVACEVHC